MIANSSLLRPENRGGADAARGFFFQDAYIASHVPDWLANPEFAALLKEGVGDAEVAYGESADRKRTLYQVKDHHVPPAEFASVIRGFYEKDQAAPGTYSQFVLACRSLGEGAESVRQGLCGLAGASPMYGERDRPLTDTKQDITDKLKKLGLEVPVGFILEKVRFDTELGDLHSSDQRLSDQFIGAMERCIPKWAGNSGLRNAYEAIRNKIQGAIRVTLTRVEIEQLIQDTLDRFPARAHSEGISVRLYHWEDPPFDPSQSCDVLIDWSQHFDRKTRRVPRRDVWLEQLLPELEHAQETIRGSTDIRLIKLYPHACLSAGIAVGWAFREVKGYTLTIPQRTELWRSDATPSARSLRAEICEEQLSSRNLCVAFSATADVTSKVNQFINNKRAEFRARLCLVPDTGPGAMLDGPTALAFAHQAKQLIRQAVDRFHIDTVHLFYAGPLGLAMFLGRLFNAMHADIQCYEEELGGDYTPSCRLPAN